jgi:hypothetical protein
MRTYFVAITTLAILALSYIFLSFEWAVLIGLSALFVSSDINTKER